MTAYAQLNEKEIGGLKECEDEMGVILIAYEKPVPPANINTSSLEKIKSLEKEIGVKLVAYE
ncbi:hypothetical protein J2128_001641 [Methanomicrobium sp. W14]|uniref:hypothetical protein n=1 Tax=Methanomicrobium sp. W14 TaxID=2817839 RepID=UPI001AE2EDBE|nr:hypothetical protein [Methanomicrobium sp. W14]MBP2133687.1 hypothetical protein [Methanomicrobium sp. W14]